MVNKCVSSFYLDFKFEHDRMIRSLVHFHPEVNMEVKNRKEYLKMRLTYWGYPVMELPLFQRYSTVTHIDADVIVVDRIDELFDDSSDVRAGRNNSDKNRCANHAGVELPGIPWSRYVNAGIHSVSSERFMEKWLMFSALHVHEYQYFENDTFNIMFHSGDYRSVILDPIEGNLHYGTSFLEGVVTYWDLWKEIYVAGDHLELNGKRVKMLHMAGGLPTRPPIEQLVTKRVNEFIQEIIK